MFIVYDFLTFLHFQSHQKSASLTSRLLSISICCRISVLSWCQTFQSSVCCKGFPLLFFSLLCMSHHVRASGAQKPPWVGFAIKRIWSWWLWLRTGRVLKGSAWLAQASLFFIFCYFSIRSLAATWPVKPAIRRLLFKVEILDSCLLHPVLSCVWICCPVSYRSCNVPTLRNLFSDFCGFESVWPLHVSFPVFPEVFVCKPPEQKYKHSGVKLAAHGEDKDAFNEWDTEVFVGVCGWDRRRNGLVCTWIFLNVGTPTCKVVLMWAAPPVSLYIWRCAFLCLLCTLWSGSKMDHFLLQIILSVKEN